MSTSGLCFFCLQTEVFHGNFRCVTPLYGSFLCHLFLLYFQYYLIHLVQNKCRQPKTFMNEVEASQNVIAIALLLAFDNSSCIRVRRGEGCQAQAKAFRNMRSSF